MKLRYSASTCDESDEAYPHIIWNCQTCFANESMWPLYTPRAQRSTVFPVSEDVEGPQNKDYAYGEDSLLHRAAGCKMLPTRAGQKAGT